MNTLQHLCLKVYIYFPSSDHVPFFTCMRHGFKARASRYQNCRCLEVITIMRLLWVLALWAVLDLIYSSLLPISKILVSLIIRFSYIVSFICIHNYWQRKCGHFNVYYIDAGGMTIVFAEEFIAAVSSCCSLHLRYKGWLLQEVWQLLYSGISRLLIEASTAWLLLLKSALLPSLATNRNDRRTISSAIIRPYLVDLCMSFTRVASTSC